MRTIARVCGAVTVLSAVAVLAACSDVGVNQSCTSNCFSLNGIEGLTPEQVDAKVKKMCEGMGRKGKPEITQRSKTAVAGTCPA